MTAEVTRIWVRPEASAELLDEMATTRGWKLAASEARVHAFPTRRLWRLPEGGEVGWLEDHTLGVRFAWTGGDGSTNVETELRAKLPHFTRDELLSAASAEQIPEALHPLRVLCWMERGTLSEELRALLVRFMAHENRVVRRAVIHLCWTGEWPVLLPDVERRSKEDGELGEEWARLAKAMREKKA